jgi:hypothetical protein
MIKLTKPYSNHGRRSGLDCHLPVQKQDSKARPGDGRVLSKLQAFEVEKLCQHNVTKWSIIMVEIISFSSQLCTDIHILTTNRHLTKNHFEAGSCILGFGGK